MYIFGVVYIKVFIRKYSSVCSIQGRDFLDDTKRYR
nr:MAG TPA: hypothetical protein [Caudoviricetes sp.]DAV22578.1 MAG TPA: hypothetical protein [Caudoviricetes sp.]